MGLGLPMAVPAGPGPDARLVELVEDYLGASVFLALSLFLTLTFAMAAVGFGFPMAVAAGPGPVSRLLFASLGFGYSLVIFLSILFVFGIVSSILFSAFWTREVEFDKVSARECFFLSETFFFSSNLPDDSVFGILVGLFMCSEARFMMSSPFESLSWMDFALFLPTTWGSSCLSL